MANTLVVEYDPLAASVQSDPYPYYAALPGHFPVRYVDTLNAYVVSRHADVRRVMRDHQSFSSEAMAALVPRPAQYAADADLVQDAGDSPAVARRSRRHRSFPPSPESWNRGVHASPNRSARSRDPRCRRRVRRAAGRRRDR